MGTLKRKRVHLPPGPRPEEDPGKFSGRHGGRPDDSAAQPRPGANRGSVPNDAFLENRPRGDAGLADDAAAGNDSPERRERQDLPFDVEDALLRAEIAARFERVQRGRQEIARRPQVEKTSGVDRRGNPLARLDQRPPEILDNRSEASLEARQDARRDNRNAGKEKGVCHVAAPAGDPFPVDGERREPRGITIGSDQESDGRAGIPVKPYERSEVRVELGIHVPNKKIAVFEERFGVFQRAGGPENFRLAEKPDADSGDRLPRELLDDLEAFMVEIDRCFRDTESGECVEPPNQ